MRADPLLHFSVEVDPDLVALDALRRLRRDPTFFWDEPSTDRLIAGFGAAWDHTAASGPGRITRSAGAASDVFARTSAGGDHEAPGPVVVGGFSFSDHPELEPPGDAVSWSEFPPGLLVLPELTIRRSKGRAWIGVVRGDEDETAAAAAVGDIVTQLSRPQVGGRSDAARRTRISSIGEGAFDALVKDAVAEVESGTLAKVVAARSASITAEVDPWLVLDRLRRRYPSCAVYGIFRRETVFVGASPELLVELHGGRVSANALAGTVRRGSDRVDDSRLEERLRHDPKELAEHQYVVQGLRRALSEVGVALDPPSGVDILKLANVQHLASPVSGTAPPGTAVLDLVAAVHPTPAVAGMPRSAALRWIAEHEALDRGWYAGPIGWMDASLDGSFRVALRCALLGSDHARAFAGAGIVAGSEPHRELGETSEKLGAILGALDDAW